jgi:hypothetical protein
MKVITESNLVLAESSDELLKSTLCRLLADPNFLNSDHYHVDDKIYDRFEIIDSESNYVLFHYYEEYQVYMTIAYYCASDGIHYCGSSINAEYYISCIMDAIKTYRSRKQLCLFV